MSEIYWKTKQGAMFVSSRKKYISKSLNKEMLSNNCIDDYDFDEMEATLLGEDLHFTGGSRVGNASNAIELGKKVNLSTRTQNDIARCEKKGEKRYNYIGRDDRATSEQVLDPRTRLILFKLLSAGYLTVIDGNFLPTHIFATCDDLLLKDA